MNFYQLLTTTTIFLLALGSPTLSTATPYMGFSSWPPDLTDTARTRIYTLLQQDTNITLQHLDNGIPWNQALKSKPYPRAVMDDWKYRKIHSPIGHKLVIAITPLNSNRDGLAPYWSNNGDNLPLPKKWQNKALNDLEVMEAYSNYALAVADYFKPDYLAISIESNVLISKAPDKIEPFAHLYVHTYQRLKERYPEMKVFTTIQYEHLRGIDDDSKQNLSLQKPVMASLLPYTDLIGLSTYRFGPAHPNPIKPNYFNEALAFGKPLAITESGAISKGFHASGMDYLGSQTDQAKFVEMVLEQAFWYDFEFVINWAGIDFDPLVSRLPADVQDSAKLWMYTGLKKFNGEKKQAYEVWRRYLSRH